MNTDNPQQNDYMQRMIDTLIHWQACMEEANRFQMAAINYGAKYVMDEKGEGCHTYSCWDALNAMRDRIAYLERLVDVGEVSNG